MVVWRKDLGFGVLRRETDLSGKLIESPTRLFSSDFELVEAGLVGSVGIGGVGQSVINGLFNVGYENNMNIICLRNY